jgi:hypothetical protein
MIRHIPFDRLHNFRDLGGYPAADGRTVRWQRLYRSDSLGKLRGDATDEKRFLDLGIRTVIDLRYPWEADRGGRVPELDGLRYHNLSIEHRPYNQASLTNDFDPWRYLADRFQEVAHDGTAEIRQALSTIADPEAGPTVFHCTSGKDRSGIIAASSSPSSASPRTTSSPTSPSPNWPPNTSSPTGRPLTPTASWSGMPTGARRPNSSTTSSTTWPPSTAPCAATPPSGSASTTTWCWR